MRIWAALDILGGKAVHLTEGKVESAVVFSENPVDTVRAWRAQGIDGFHVIDLDAAFGTGTNRGLLRELVKASDGAEIQVGGGIKSTSDLDMLFAAGVKRAIVGTVLISAPEKFHQLCEAYPRQILAGIDARDREVRISGWTEGSAVGLEDAVLRALALGATGAVVTDIAREGKDVGPNVDLLQDVIEHLPPSFELIAAGGIASEDDLVILKVIGRVAGAVVGKALTDGRIGVREAMARLAGGKRSWA